MGDGQTSAVTISFRKCNNHYSVGPAFIGRAGKKTPYVMSLRNTGRRFNCVAQRIVTAIVAYWRVCTRKACWLEKNKVARFYDMKAYGSVEVRRHLFLTSPPDKGRLSADGTFSVPLRTRTPSYSTHWMVVWVGLKRRYAFLKLKKKLLPLPGLESLPIKEWQKCSLYIVELTEATWVIFPAPIFLFRSSCHSEIIMNWFAFL
jgi:hypothetical protein